MRHDLMAGLRAFRAWLRAFTLIELLTVIAIIGVLAAILIPTTQTIRNHARKAVAKNDVEVALGAAIRAYINDFGAPPPDSNAPLPHEAGGNRFENMDTPIECLVWFLTRQYSTSTTAAQVAGRPWDANGGWTVPPSNAEIVYARKAGGPYLDLSGKKKRDYDQDGFYEMADPWGRPYLYRAYRQRKILNIVYDAGTGRSRVYLEGKIPPGGGQVTISGTSNNDGTKDVVASGDTWFEFTGGVSEAPTAGMATMEKLHNANKEFDLYSVGINGKTRKAAVVFAAPYGPAQTSAVWGSPEDGNDLAPDQGGNDSVPERDRDDICNWAD